MKKFYLLLILIVSAGAFSCGSDSELTTGAESNGYLNSSITGSGEYAGGDHTGGDHTGGDGGQGGQGGQAGKITAGEWNDLEHWDFWSDLMNEKENGEKTTYWGFYLNNRIGVELTDNSNNPFINAKVNLKQNGKLIWEAMTDNLGKADLWIDPFNKTQAKKSADLKLYVNGQAINQPLKSFGEGVNKLKIDQNQDLTNKVELAFIVDATGSMGDELNFLKEDLKSVIERVGEENKSLTISTSSIFYRDEGDDYITRKSAFTNSLNTTLDFISQQNAGGGGDFPEAVHTAMDEGINNLQWSANAKTRIAFLLLDAPPHYEPQIVDHLHKSIKEAAKKGIKLIPITASGIDKETEFLMRFFAITTSGTYVFITNDSGIGNEHLEPTIGDYDVELLNDLMVRLITKYSE